VKTLDPVIHRIRKEAILQQARHMFATRGFAETSMDDIARGNHVQKASLYHYFKSKQQVLEDMIDLEGQRWAAQIKDYHGTDLRESLLHTGKTFLKYLDDAAGREFFQIIQFESHKNPVILKAFKDNPTYKRGVVLGVMSSYLENKLPAPKIAMLAIQFIGSLIHYARLSRLHGKNMCAEKFSDAEFVEQLVNVILHGVKVV
jgi:AcrR family transcriptional regulator